MNNTLTTLRAEGLKSTRALSEKYPVHEVTLKRWAIRGVKLPSGEVIRLEAFRFPGRWMSSEAAVERFLAAINRPVKLRECELAAV